MGDRDGGRLRFDSICENDVCIIAVGKTVWVGKKEEDNFFNFRKIHKKLSIARRRMEEKRIGSVEDLLDW